MITTTQQQQGGQRQLQLQLQLRLVGGRQGRLQGFSTNSRTQSKHTMIEDRSMVSIPIHPI